MAEKKKDSSVVADKEAPAEKAKKVDTTWKDKPDAKITRVFRQTDWYKNPSTKKLGVANLPKRRENGTDMPAVSKILRPNHACQYVLDRNAVAYERQLEGLRQHEEAGFVEEIDPIEKGKIGIPPYVPTEIEKDNARLKAEVAELKKQLEASSADAEDKEDA